jgi:hypothetical protein
MSKKLALVLAAATFVGGFAINELSRSAVYAQPETPAAGKGPKWSHGLMLRVRKADQPDFDKNTPKIGVEVFTDENNGNLIYITDTGSISVVKK